mgnify:CR=1 FL=1
MADRYRLKERLKQHRDKQRSTITSGIIGGGMLLGGGVLVALVKQFVGYKFLGWNPSTSTVITEDTTFIANFEILTYTVEWSGYSTGVITQTYNHGDALILPDSPALASFTKSKIIEITIKINPTIIPLFSFLFLTTTSLSI